MHLDIFLPKYQQELLYSNLIFHNTPVVLPLLFEILSIYPILFKCPSSPLNLPLIQKIIQGGESEVDSWEKEIWWASDGHLFGFFLFHFFLSIPDRKQGEGGRRWKRGESKRRPFGFNLFHFILFFSVFLRHNTRCLLLAKCFLTLLI